MSTPTPRPIPRPLHTAIALGVAMLGCAASFQTARALGGSAETATWGAIVLGAASLAGVGAALLPARPESWGTIVLGGSALRFLLVIMVGYGIDSQHQLDRRAYWLSLLVGALAVLITEAVGAILAIHRAEKSRLAPHTPAGTEPPRP